MLGVHQQVQFVAKPRDDLGDVSLVVLVLLTPPARLRQAVSVKFDLVRLVPNRARRSRFCLRSCFLGGLGTVAPQQPRFQRRGVSRRIPPQVGHDLAQPLDHLIEYRFQFQAVRFLAEHIEEPRQVPSLGNLVGGLQADQFGQRRVTTQFRQAGFESRVPQSDGQKHHAPQGTHGIIIASLAAGGFQSFDEFGVGDRLQQLFDGGQEGMVFQAIPGE